MCFVGTTTLVWSNSRGKCAQQRTLNGSDFIMSHLEIISDGEQALCYILRAGQLPDRTTFITPDEFKQQVGFVVYPAGGEVARHDHRPLERHLTGTSEVLLVQKGRCWMDVYNGARELVATRELAMGDLILMVGGGHGFRMIEDTVFLEIKQGPYTGLDEKEKF